MQLSLRRVLAIIVLFSGFTSSVTFFLFIKPKPPVHNDSIPLVEGAMVTIEQEQEQVLPGLPVRLHIPKVDIDTTIDHMGLTSDGAMEITESIIGVTWFKFGQRPGEPGSAVIAGHYGWKNGELAVFNDLHTLEQGDKIYVEDQEGVIFTFVVRETRIYDPDSDASDVFGSNDTKPHLNLITCQGTWNTSKDSLTKRLVVFTDLLE